MQKGGYHIRLQKKKKKKTKKITCGRVKCKWGNKSKKE